MTAKLVAFDRKSQQGRLIVDLYCFPIELDLERQKKKSKYKTR